MQIHLPHHRYECTGCGRCCRAAWTIAVDDLAEPGIRQSHSYASKKSQGYRPLKVVGERLALSKAPDNTCVFLDSDNLCDLHGELGARAKPIVCQTYPYLFIETPDGVYTALSYACPAVLEQHGDWVEQERESLTSLLNTRWDDLPQAPSIGQRIEVCRGQSISWSEYRELEPRLLDAFSPQDPVCSLLRIAVNLLVTTSSQHQAFPLPALNLEKTPNLGGFDLQLLAMVSCNLMAVTEDDITDPKERAELGSLLWNGGAYHSTKLNANLSGFHLMKPQHQELAEVVERYVQQAVLGKRLLLGTVVSRLLALACGISVLLFYQQALELQEASGAFSWSAMDRAFTLVESELLSHTRSFDGFFQEFEEALSNIRDTLQT